MLGLGVPGVVFGNLGLYLDRSSRYVEFPACCLEVVEFPSIKRSNRRGEWKFPRNSQAFLTKKINLPRHQRKHPKNHSTTQPSNQTSPPTNPHQQPTHIPTSTTNHHINNHQPPFFCISPVCTSVGNLVYLGP